MSRAHQKPLSRTAVRQILLRGARRRFGHPPDRRGRSRMYLDPEERDFIEALVRECQGIRVELAEALAVCVGDYFAVRHGLQSKLGGTT